MSMVVSFHVSNNPEYSSIFHFLEIITIIVREPRVAQSP